MTRRICLVSGSGDLPAAVAAAVRDRGEAVTMLSLVGHEPLDGVELLRVEPGRIDLVLGMIARLGPSHIALAAYAPEATLAALRAYAASAGLPAAAGAAELARGLGGLVTKLTGAAFIGIGELAPELVAPAGPIAGPAPDGAAMAACRAALERARSFGLRDIGQAIVLLPGGEAMEEDAEGTDALLVRVAAAGRRGGILAKAAKPQQPLFADLPVIGPVTLANAARAGIAAIALEAGRTLIVDRPGVRRGADAAGIGVVGVDG